MAVKIYVIAHNIRSAHNIGSIMRTAEGFGVDKLYLTGYSPYPWAQTDKRLPHEAKTADRAISKTALGAEKSLNWAHAEIDKVIDELKGTGFLIAALEQSPKAKSLKAYKNSRNIALILGNEVKGIDQAVLQQADVILQIPMAGSKESFNVAASAAVALYHIKYLA